MKFGKILMTGAVALALATPAVAATYEKTTVTSPEGREGVRVIDFMKFDANKDGILSRKEVGQELFYIFDTDGNEVIDNMEINNKNVYTFSPMKKETTVKVDFNDDGVADVNEYTIESFMDRSNLARFDKNDDGLSAVEFIGQSFLKLDDNNDKAVDIAEWQEAYTESLSPLAAEQERYN